MEEVRESKRPKISTQFPLNDGIIFHGLSNPSQLIINEGAGFNLSGSALVANENAVGFGKTLQFQGFGTIKVGHMGDGTSESTCIWRGKKRDGDITDYAILTFQHEKNLGKNENFNVLTQAREHNFMPTSTMTVEQSLNCTFCYQRMEVGRDVSTLITKEGLPLCESFNEQGWFEVYHTSCLLHWVLYQVAKDKYPYCPACFGSAPKAIDVTLQSTKRLYEEQMEMFRSNQQWTSGSNGPTGSNVPISKTGLKFRYTYNIPELKKSLPFYRAI